jgi:hypothetical protein
MKKIAPSSTLPASGRMAFAPAAVEGEFALAGRAASFTGCLLKRG